MVFLPRIPLTTNGKIDRQALPAPEQVQAKEYLAPRNQTEESIAKIWAEVLRRDRISVDDNFFDLGGHSLMATQVISRIRRALSIDLPLRKIFEAPTVAKLSEHIAHSGKMLPAQAPPPITRVSRDGPLPLSFAQQRLWVLDQFQPNNSLYNIPRAVRMKGPLNVDALSRSLNEIIGRHESQRTTFTTINREPVQVITPSLTIPFPMHDLTTLPASEREPEARRIAASEAGQPFDLAKGPLVRAALVRFGREDHVLLLTMHHIVSDAWSAGVFVSEMSDLYEAFVAGKASPLPELPVQYADYAAWQRNWLKGEVLEAQLKYWRDQLKGAPPVIELPSDRPRPATQSFEGAYESVPLSEEISRLVTAFSQQHGVTTFMTLVAAFQALLSRYSGQEQIVVGTDLANRTSAETEKLIGFFINVLPLRTDLSGNPTFKEVVSRVREVALGAYAHQDMPFDKLVEELKPERSLSHNPLVQVLFVMQNIPKQRRELAGLKLEPFAMPLTRSKFDLAAFMVEEGQHFVSNWLYSTDLFERSTILRIAANFETVLQHALASPETRLSALEILSDAEKKQREQEKKQRKQSQLKKLMTAEPKAFSVGSGDSKK
jgi:acyl carrier protein